MTVLRLPTAAAALTYLGLSACTPPQGKNAAVDKGPSARDRAAMVVHDYQSATNAEDPERLAALYDDDALLLPPDGGVVRGRREIAAFWRDGLERGLSMDTVKVVTGDSLGWVVGRYYLAATESAPPDSGKFLLALARVDGEWKVAADIWNATPSEGDDDSEGDPRTRILSAVPARFVEGPGSRVLDITSGPSPRARQIASRSRSSQ